MGRAVFWQLGILIKLTDIKGLPVLFLSPIVWWENKCLYDFLQWYTNMSFLYSKNASTATLQNQPKLLSMASRPSYWTAHSALSFYLAKLPIISIISSREPQLTPISSYIVHIWYNGLNSELSEGRRCACSSLYPQPIYAEWLKDRVTSCSMIINPTALFWSNITFHSHNSGFFYSLMWMVKKKATQ